ncbi:hypothetical protein G6011_00322 [Alternaria panax]|uniref:Uncharacterized protein n=1 Tax=Alternaria panax TaxID=48097 RepID=A0AAD4NUM0_9PLEO|nr:hypothetical protein G6011_00322 [Alternaria panax]
MGPAIGKEKRGRARRKSQMSVRKIPKAGSKVEPSTRVGASQELPITLDSDDDASASSPSRPVYHPTDISLIDPNLGSFHYDPHGSPRHKILSRGSVHAPLENTYAPTGFVLRRSSPAFTRDKRRKKWPDQIETQRILLAPPRTKTSLRILSKALFIMKKQHECASLPNSANVIHVPVLRQQKTVISQCEAQVLILRFSNAIPYGRSKAMADDRTSRMPTYIKPDTPIPRRTQSENKRPRECKPGDMNMSLLDIDDFGMRGKVAQLMAVAPALAVMDHNHLIIDRGGDLPCARKQATRMSEAPAVQYRQGLDTDGDEVMVKIDPNDPAFE